MIASIKPAQHDPGATALYAGGRESGRHQHGGHGGQCHRCGVDGHKAAACEAGMDQVRLFRSKHQAYLATPIQANKVIADNGATVHLVTTLDGLSNVKNYPPGLGPRLQVAGGMHVTATATGDKEMHVLAKDGSTRTILLRECMVIPGARGCAVVSIGRLMQDKQARVFTQTRDGATMELFDGATVILNKENGLVVITTDRRNPDVKQKDVTAAKQERVQATIEEQEHVQVRADGVMKHRASGYNLQQPLCQQPARHDGQAARLVEHNVQEVSKKGACLEEKLVC